MICNHTAGSTAYWLANDAATSSGDRCLVVLGQVLLDCHLRDQEPDFGCRPLHAVDGRPCPATFDQRRGRNILGVLAL